MVIISLKNISDNFEIFRGCSLLRFSSKLYFNHEHNCHIKSKFKILETISALIGALDQNSSMPFLRNEFSKILAGEIWV